MQNSNEVLHTNMIMRLFRMLMHIEYHATRTIIIIIYTAYLFIIYYNVTKFQLNTEQAKPFYIL